MRLPTGVKERLGDPVFRRSDFQRAQAAFEALGIDPSGALGSFYGEYEGPFGGAGGGLELLDLCEESPNVVEVTKLCRDEFGWPPGLIVLTELFGNAVLVFNTEDDCVYNVDLEGGDEQLLNGELAPAWRSLHDFLSEFLGP